jgi:hypothetical protein
VKKDKKGTLIVLDSIIECLRSERSAGDFITSQEDREAYISYLDSAKEFINTLDEQKINFKKDKSGTLIYLGSIVRHLRTDFPADHYITNWVFFDKGIKNPERYMRNIYASYLESARELIDTLVEED